MKRWPHSDIECKKGPHRLPVGSQGPEKAVRCLFLMTPMSNPARNQHPNVMKAEFGKSLLSVRSSGSAPFT